MPDVMDDAATGYNPAQVWTQTCWLAEQANLSLDVLNALARCAIFEFPAESVQAALTMAKDDRTSNGLQVPFDDIAMVDSRGSVVFYNCDRTGGELQTSESLVIRRGGLDKLPEAPTSLRYLLRANALVMTPTEAAIREQLGISATITLGTVFIGEGQFIDCAHAGVYRMDGRDCWVFDAKMATIFPLFTYATALAKAMGRGQSYVHDMLQIHYEQFVSACNTAVEELTYATKPIHYLVEEFPPGYRPPPRWVPAKGKTYTDEETGRTTRRPMIPRFQERSIIRYIHPDRVRVIRPPQPGASVDRGPTAPHLRRAHTRVLRSERYKAAKGRVVHIRPTWVGEREWQHDRIRYRVISG